VQLSGNTNGVTVAGNFIGTDSTGLVGLGNTLSGVQIINAQNNTIGGTTAGAANVIGDNRRGAMIRKGNAQGNQFLSNRIGVDAAGNSLGNQFEGIKFDLGAKNNTIGGTAAGAGNTIAHNGQEGIALLGGVGNAIRQNSMFENGSLGIDLNDNGLTPNDANDPDTGANNLQNSPEIQSVVLNATNLDIQALVDSTTSNSQYDLTLEFFIADADGQEGETFLGDATYASGDAQNIVTVSVPAGAAGLGTEIVATATDDDGNTSEFSASVVVGSSLLAAGGEASQESRVESQELETDDLSPIVDAAIDRFMAAGYSSELFQYVDVSIADLPGATLGLATGTSIVIDVDAAGYGWFVDATPLDDSEFTVGESLRDSYSASRSAAATRMDLLTVVMHELGHTASLEDLYDVEAEDDLMYAWLEAGERRTPNETAIDRVFALLE
jgi:parallel beta-helix repeat protein